MGLLRRSRMPSPLAGALRPDETVLANARLADGGWLAATRFGLWSVPDGGEPQQWSWPLVSKVRWQPPMLSLTVADVVGVLGDADVIVDRTPLSFEVVGSSRLTDIVHQRVRSGIVSSTHHLTEAGGLWVVLRRVPGRDGLAAQVRADPGTALDDVQDQVTEIVRSSLAQFGGPG